MRITEPGVSAVTVAVAEMLARSATSPITSPVCHAPQASAFRAHLELAVGDHVTGIAELAFHDDRLSGVDANGVSRPRHLFERHRGEGREHRQPGQQRHLHHRHLGVRIGTAQ